MPRSNPRNMRLSLVARAFVLALAVVGWAAAPALAAPQLLSSDPEAGAEMHAPPDRVTLEFSEPLEESSDIEVTDDCGDAVHKGDATFAGVAGNEMSIAIGAAPHHGTYTVTYVATGVTGTATGDYTFTVHGGKSCSGGRGGHDHDDDKDGNDDKDHGDHDGDRDDHDDGDHGDGTKDHSDMDHSAGSGRHDMQDGGMHGAGKDHGKKKHGRHDGKGHQRHHNDDPGGDNAIAAPPFDLPSDIPTGATVAVGLGLAVLLGAVGGWVLRVSSPS